MIRRPVFSKVAGVFHRVAATTFALVIGFILSTACREWWALLFVLALYVVHPRPEKSFFNRETQ